MASFSDEVGGRMKLTGEEEGGSQFDRPPQHGEL
jgi:hypothetical protein